MPDHFNGLTPAEAERLAMLAEELGEATQAIGKILRHGYESYNPHVALQYRIYNRDALARELGDVQAIIEWMIRHGDIKRSDLELAALQKQQKMPRYAHHQTAPAA